MENIFFDGWESFWRELIKIVLAYISIVFFLRISGKRTLTKMNAFDLIVTIALGSMLAAVSLNKNIALFDGVIAFMLLIFLQYILTWLSVRSKKFKNIITSNPSLLIYKGELLEDTMIKERITLDELNMAVRNQGISDISKVDVLILETTGDISIISSVEGDKKGTFTGIKKDQF
nr:DUF421 domain-containing protein [Cytophagales bacterium]